MAKEHYQYRIYLDLPPHDFNTKDLMCKYCGYWYFCPQNTKCLTDDEKIIKDIIE
jgi:hypothetical protein